MGKGAMRVFHGTSMACRLLRFLSFLSVFGLPSAGTAHGASILMDARNGTILVGDEPSLPWPPASLTKLMTLYLTFSAVQSDALKLDQMLKVSSHAAGQLGSRLGLAIGSGITVKQAILGMITQSGNDAAMVLAEAVAGSEAAFVTAMNQEAKLLGLNQSSFTNPTGLPDLRQRTSALDMALLSRALWHDYPVLYHFFNARRMDFGGRQLPTINNFLASYRGADGLKTGTTCDAGHNLAASAERDGVRLIGIVLGAPDISTRNANMMALLDEGFGPAVSGNGLPAMDSQRKIPRHPEWRIGTCRAGAPSTLPRQSTLAGWGVILGIYAREIHAQRAIELAQASVGLPAREGQPKIVPLKSGGYFNAVLVGLKEKDADATCLMLRRNGAYCIRLDPRELNDPDAIWRN
jgi:D-alanyl-D-alanine carboxypeptidase